MKTYKGNSNSCSKDSLYDLNSRSVLWNLCVNFSCPLFVTSGLVSRIRGVRMCLDRVRWFTSYGERCDYGQKRI